MTDATPERTAASRDPLAMVSEACLASLYERSGAARWELSRQQFDEALRASVSRNFSRLAAPAVTRRDVEHYLGGLRLEDLALACACAAGLEAAWERFVAEYREPLYAAARAILGSARDPERARELADSLYADLYGLEGPADARRKPLFVYFHGRSSLGTWLRAVLAQRHVDAIRAARRIVPLEDACAKSALPAPRVAGGPLAAAADPDRARLLPLLHDALRVALSLLPPRDRALLRSYYLDALTLAEIGRTRGEHESTVSRQLDRCRRELRARVERRLLDGSPATDGCAARPGLSPTQVDLCFDCALDEWPFDLARSLDATAPAKPREKAGPAPRSLGEGESE